MRSHFFRVAASVAALGVGSISLVACSKDSVKSSTDTTAAAAASSDTTAAAAAAADTTAAAAAADTTAAAAAADTAAAAAAAPSNTIGQSTNQNIFYTAVGAGQFLTLAKLLVVSDLLDTIKEGGPFTVFAPTDAAFAKVPKETLAAVAADKEKLKKVLLYHVVPGKLTSAQLASGDLKTAEGSTLKITNDGITLKANDATVALPDVGASNGVIQVIDSVLLPPDL